MRPLGTASTGLRPQGCVHWGEDELIKLDLWDDRRDHMVSAPRTAFGGTGVFCGGCAGAGEAFPKNRGHDIGDCAPALRADVDAAFGRSGSGCREGVRRPAPGDGRDSRTDRREACLQRARGGYETRSGVGWGIRIAEALLV